MINPADIVQYCQIVFADQPLGGVVALRGFAEKGSDKPPYLVWVDPCATNWTQAVVSFVAECDRRGLAAYCIPGFVRPGGAGAADVLTLPTLVVDFDSGDIAGKCLKLIALLGPASLCVHSGGLLEGSPKVHLYWRLAGDCGALRVARLRKAAADHAGADGSFERPAQPIRIAGSVHRKGTPVAVTIAYQTSSVIPIEEVEQRLVSVQSTTSLSQDAHCPQNDSEGANTLGLSRVVSIDDLPGRYVGHGANDITRFEAITRMMGMMLAQIHDANDDAAVAREFGYFRQWAVSHIENVERDYDLRQHWRRLLSRERWKRRQPRRPRARPQYMNR